MDPIIRLVKAIMDDNIEGVIKMLANKEITLNSDEQQLRKKNLLRTVFMKWLNAADALLEMIVTKLPSPA